VLLRSLATTIASALPVISLLLIGAGLLGQVTLREFAIALLVGMITGAYSSLFVASPMLGWLKSRSSTFRRRKTGDIDHLTGDALRQVVVGGISGVRTSSRRRPAGATAVGAPDADEAATDGSGGAPARTTTASAPPADVLLSHAPRPRKKKRR
jgi:preprotein translocase subunit SecF